MTIEIPGVVLKLLQTHSDERGFFRELIRRTDTFFGDSFVQWSHSRMIHNTVKAWHFHHLQTDWWYCPIGVLEVVLVDHRPESPCFRRKEHFHLGDRMESAECLDAIVRIPPGVLHGCRVLSPKADLLYITDRLYNPEDEGRLPFNSPDVDHDWGNHADLVVTEKDRREFIPRFSRTQSPTGADR